VLLASCVKAPTVAARLGKVAGAQQSHRRGEGAELAADVEDLVDLVVLVEVVEAADEIETSVQQGPLRGNHLQLVALALAVEAGVAAEQVEGREDHVAVALLVAPVAIGVDQAQGVAAAELPAESLLTPRWMSARFRFL
jgi:hypothetical protein